MQTRLLLPIVACLAVTLSMAPRGESQQATPEAQVDAMFSGWTSETPGCAVGATVKGKTVIRAAYGMADLEHDVPNTPETIFEVGSVSKQFTAAAVLLLARDGKLSLDDPARRYVPELPDFGTPITIRQLLHHTSGLRDWGNLFSIAGAPRTSRFYTQAHLLDILSRQRALDFEPDARWGYSNSGYNLAAIIVARVSGMSFADFTRTRLFEPLGMKNSSFQDEYRTVVKRRAIAYSQRQDRFIADMPNENVYGNRGLLTTVDDLLKWSESFFTHTVGDAAFVAEMERRASLTGGREHEYALGTYVDTYRGLREVDHSGGIGGYAAYLSRYPDQQVSVAVLCNGRANTTAMGKAVANLYLTGLRPGVEPNASHALTDTEANRLVGLYRARFPPKTARIVRENNALLVQDVARLIPTSPTRFLTGDQSAYEFDGRMMRVTDEFGVVTVYDRVEPVSPTREELQQFAGRYVSDEIETTLIAAVDGEGLVLRRRPATTIALTPVSADFFSSAGWWVTFRRDPSGRVAGLSVGVRDDDSGPWDLLFSRQPESAPTTTQRP